ncbi:hypothetical protein CEP52_014115 [Fusarium oligoseptatum]|uniref:Uncharacterized protein n=1 Tax=Fusarium oligoseptatum TaxID=2604345 RepID=A0A428SQ63_9HYPO|nr:hypothetical protein CEP52_014115 [Fusarium oligoseptatum]
MIHHQEHIVRFGEKGQEGHKKKGIKGSLDRGYPTMTRHQVMLRTLVQTTHKTLLNALSEATSADNLSTMLSVPTLSGRNGLSKTDSVVNDRPESRARVHCHRPTLTGFRFPGRANDPSHRDFASELAMLPQRSSSIKGSFVGA